MAIGVSVPRTRRALLAGGLGGLAALVASALGRPPAADAASGTFDSSTYVVPAVRATHTAGGDGVRGSSSSGIGIYGSAYSGNGVYGWTSSGVGVNGYGSTGVGVQGSSSHGVGVEGSSSSGDGVVGSSYGSSKSGVYGYSTVKDGYGVFGRNKATGSTGYLGGLAGVVGESTSSYPAISGYTTIGTTGVYGRADKGSGIQGVSQSGAGVHGEATSGVGGHFLATTGYALRTSGRLKVDKASGVATIGATKSAVTVTPGLNVTDASFVLLTPKADLGTRRLWYTTNPTANTVTIRVSSPVTANLKVGWLLLG